jgi:hypothetical protein
MPRKRGKSKPPIGCGAEDPERAGAGSACRRSNQQNAHEHRPSSIMTRVCAEASAALSMVAGLGWLRAFPALAVYWRLAMAP